MKMLFAVNVDLWNPLSLYVVPNVPKSKDIRIIGIYNDDKENAIEHMIAKWIVDVMQSRNLVFKPSISTYTIKEDANAVDAWSLFVNNVSYAFFTTKDDVEPDVPMVLSFDHGQFRPYHMLKLIKWDMDMAKRLIRFINANVEEKLKAIELKG